MDIDDIRQARERIRPYVRRTPLERSDSLSRRLDTNIYVKYELFQKTGSFKARGAFNKILSLSADELAKGVVAVSGGNHAQAVAYAASVLGAGAVIVMPESTPRNYVDATRGYGATVDLQPTIAAAFETSKAYQDQGRAFLHPFDVVDNIAFVHRAMIPAMKQCEMKVAVEAGRQPQLPICFGDV